MNAKAWTLGLGVAALIGAGVALADDRCEARVADWQPRSAVVKMAEAMGWQVESIRVDDGCYQIRALDAQGQRLRAKVDPATLEVVKLKRRGDGHGEGRGEERGEGRRWRGGEGDGERRSHDRRRRGGDEDDDDAGRGAGRAPPPPAAPEPGLIGKPKAEIR